MPSPGESDRSAVVIEHLADIAAGRCTITDQQIDEAAQTDPLLAEMLTGLLFLHEDLALRAAQRDRAFAEAEAANRELEAFSYSVAHDLRAPLRAIDGFSRILVDKHAAALSGEAARYLELVRSSAERMGMLIDDLLSFSRLSRQPLARRQVSPGELAREVIAELQADVTGRHVDISVGDLPACAADPALLRQVFVNLLANALKFTRSRDVANIEIGCRTDADAAGEPVYFVGDNGAGFDMRYADKLFGVFQRLHRDDEYEGTGVGLAIVERIIHRHGGRIWAGAEPDKGATFYFTLGSGRDG